MGASFSIGSGSLAGVTPVFLGDHDAGCTLPYETAMERLAAPRQTCCICFVQIEFQSNSGMWNVAQTQY